MLVIQKNSDVPVKREDFLQQAEIFDEKAEFYVTNLDLWKLINMRKYILPLIASFVEDGWLFGDADVWYAHHLSGPNRMAMGIRVDISLWIEKGIEDARDKDGE